MNLTAFPSAARPLYEAIWAQPFDQETQEFFDVSLQLAGLMAGRAAGRDLIRAKFDTKWRIFQFEWDKRGSEAQTLDFGFGPDCLDAALAKPINGLRKAALECLRIESSFVWDLMRQRFNERIEAGETKLYARFQSPLSQTVEPVPADAWVHFEVSDWRRGVSTCEASGEKLFSIHATDTGKSLLDRRSRSPTEEDYAVLLAEFARRQAQGMAPMTKRETEAWAARMNLSRDFARNVRSQVPESQKLRPGEKPRDRLRQ